MPGSGGPIAGSACGKGGPYRLERLIPVEWRGSRPTLRFPPHVLVRHILLAPRHTRGVTNDERLAAIRARLEQLPTSAAVWGYEAYVTEREGGDSEILYGIAPDDAAPEPTFAAAEVESPAVAE